MLNGKRFICFLVFVFAVLMSAQAFACFSVVVGKNASATGEVLIGHNEDNDRRIVMAQYYVPRMKWAPGSMLYLEPKAAKIPQVAETWAYYWTETLSPDGYSFSDGYINEWGVSIVSDSMITSNEKNPAIKDGGVGYGIRTAMAQRAKTAKEAVMIASDLLKTYGYFHGGRSYQIADANEAWIMQIVKGNHFVAKRVADDEIVVMSNAYTIRGVDLKDSKNVIASPDLITYAIENGWYKPAKAGDYSDFDFAKAYQADEVRDWDFNALRLMAGLKTLTGKDYTDRQNLPFSVKVSRKVTVEDVKDVLRTHSNKDLTTKKVDGFHISMDSPCNIDTQESVVIQMRANPDLIVAWKTSGRPDSSPYIPFYPASGVIPAGYNWADPLTAMKNHFAAPADWFDYNPARAWWTFIKFQTLLNYNYDLEKNALNVVKSIESDWAKNQAAVEAEAAVRLKEKRANGLEFLAGYTGEQAHLAQAVIAKEMRAVDKYQFTINADQINANDKGNVDAVLYSAKGFDATKLDRNNTRLSVGYSNGDSEEDPTPARPVSYQVKDMNGDGMADMVMTFKAADVAKRTFPGVVTDFYFRTNVGSEKVVAMDVVPVAK